MSLLLRKHNLSRDFKIQELKGPTAYFVTMHLISSEDVSNMKTIGHYRDWYFEDSIQKP
jgi:hypothetical protein